jgi:Cof subfamily protein (haloacid dehalogenase superfamily)
MSRIQLVVSDVDGTLVTTDKRLTQRAREAVARLEAAGVGFTLTSSRPPFGLRMYSEPLGVTLPLGAFNGSSIVTPTLEVIEQHHIPAAAATTALDLLARRGLDLWLFTHDNWYIRRDDGRYVAQEQRAISFAPTRLGDFSGMIGEACKIVGVSADFALLERCEIEMQAALGHAALAVRSQPYYLDITAPGRTKGSFVQAMSRRLGIPAAAIASIGDMQNDLPMFHASGLPIAMGNAEDDVKRHAAHVTAGNDDDGFAAAIDFILALNARN